MTGALGCRAPACATTLTVNANPTPTVTAGGPTTFCQGGSVKLTASSASSYLWSDGETSQSEARRVGSECRARWTPDHENQRSSAPTPVTVNAHPCPTVT